MCSIHHPVNYTYYLHSNRTSYVIHGEVVSSLIFLFFTWKLKAEEVNNIKVKGFDVKESTLHQQQ